MGGGGLEDLRHFLQTLTFLTRKVEESSGAEFTKKLRKC